jgi:hypothetical protein
MNTPSRNRVIYLIISERRNLSGETYWCQVGCATPHADGNGFDLTFIEKPNPRGELMLVAENIEEPPVEPAVPSKPPYRGLLRKHSQAKLYYKVLYPYPGEVFDDDRVEYQWPRAFARTCFTQDDWEHVHRFL